MSYQKSNNYISSAPLDFYVIDIENLNHIQRSVLYHLYLNDSGTYSDLKPRELTGNSFNYHLRHVVRQDLIEKADDKYRLTSKGRLLVDSVSLDSMKLKLRPVIGMSIVLRSDHHGILLYESHRAPLLGFTGLPFGKLRLGDSLEHTFERMLKKRGIDSGMVKNIIELGLANVRYYDQDQLVAHRTIIVWGADYTGLPETISTPHGSSVWSSKTGKDSNTLPEVETFTNWPSDKNMLELASRLS